MVFDWSNRMIGVRRPRVPDPRHRAGRGGHAGVRLRRGAGVATAGSHPKQDLISVLIDAEVEGEKLDQLELDLFFLLLIVAGNETTRNLMSGAMTAFFDHPDQWELLRQDRSLLPGAVEEMLRYVTPVMHFRRTATDGHGAARAADQGGRQGRLLAHLGQPRRVGLRGPRHLRRHPLPQQPHRLRRRRPALLPRGEPGPHGDHGDVRPPARPHTRHPASTARSSGCSRTSSTGPSTSPSPSHRPPPSGARRCPPGPAEVAAVAEHAVRFHQAVAFLPTRQILPLAKACDELGYGGMYVSDHLFNPRHLESRYTYSTREDGAPGWEDETAWPDPMCVISALAGATENLLFTTGVYIAPAARPHDGGQVGRHRGRPVGQPAAPRRRRGLVQGGVRPDRARTSPPGASAWTR